MEYKVVTSESLSIEDATNRLEKQVNELCQKGWNVRGGVCIMKDEDEWYHA